MTKQTDYAIDTRCIHGDKPLRDNFYGSLSFPIFQTASYAHRGVGDSDGYDYTRLQNPTREHAEDVVRTIEGGIDALAFSSGMAAVSALMEIFAPGDHIIAEEDLYGGSVRLFEHISEKNGLSFTRTNISSADLEPLFIPQTKAVYLESPTNPLMHISDITAVAKTAHAHDALLIVDNTFLSPYFQNPLALGADVVIHSGTKYLGGHNDTLGGFLVVGDEALSEKLRYIIKTTGAGLAPFDAWLITRGIKTLAIRMERAQESALALADFLTKQPDVTKVLYPGLPSHPGYELMKVQARGFGGMLSFELTNAKLAREVLKHVRLITFAESLGGTETLLTYPVTQTHADVAPEFLQKIGLSDRLLRLSVGIENADDLIRDLSDAFAEAKKALA